MFVERNRTDWKTQKRISQMNGSFGTDCCLWKRAVWHKSRAERGACTTLHQFAPKTTGSHRRLDIPTVSASGSFDIFSRKVSCCFSLLSRDTKKSVGWPADAFPPCHRP